MIVGKPNSFIAGADIDVIDRTEDPALAEEQIRLGQAIFSDITRVPVPTVAAIHGVCIGGGVEMALACDPRRRGSRSSSRQQHGKTSASAERQPRRGISGGRSITFMQL